MVPTAAGKTNGVPCLPVRESRSAKQPLASREIAKSIVTLKRQEKKVAGKSRTDSVTLHSSTSGGGGGWERQVFPTLRNQQIDVVAADIVLCQPHNGALQTLLTVMVCRMLRHIASQLSHLQMDNHLKEALQRNELQNHMCRLKALP